MFGEEESVAGPSDVFGRGEAFESPLAFFPDDDGVIGAGGGEELSEFGMRPGETVDGALVGLKVVAGVVVGGGRPQKRSSSCNGGIVGAKRGRTECRC